MTTKFNVGDTILIKGVVEKIFVETTDNEPVYHVRIKGVGTKEAYGVRVKEDIIVGGRLIDTDYIEKVEAENEQ